MPSRSGHWSYSTPSWCRQNAALRLSLNPPSQLNFCHFEARNFRLESLRFTVGVEAERLAYYQTLRSLLHRGLHEGFTDVSKSQAEEAVEEARWLQDRLEAWLVDRHPELTQA